MGYTLFGGDDIRVILNRREVDLLYTIDKLSDDVLLCSDAESIIQRLIEKHSVVPPTVDFAAVHISEEGRKKIDVRNDVRRPLVDNSQPCEVDGQFIILSYPVSADPIWLAYKPVTYGFRIPNAGVTADAVEYVFEGAPAVDSDMMKQDKATFENRLGKALESMTNTILSFNAALESNARSRFQARYSEAASRQSAVESLTIPKRLKKSPEPQSITPEVTKQSVLGDYEYDVFVSHAYEDKEEVVTPLVQVLRDQGCNVWIDDAVLEIGDRLTQKIDEGLRKSRYGIVVLSPNFFQKNWTQYELDGLIAREMRAGKKVILPIWHKVGKNEVATYSESLSVRVAGTTDKGLEELGARLLRVIKKGC